MNIWTVCSIIPCYVDTTKDMQQTKGSKEKVLYYNTDNCLLS